MEALQPIHKRPESLLVFGLLRLHIWIFSQQTVSMISLQNVALISLPAEYPGRDVLRELKNVYLLAWKFLWSFQNMASGPAM